jgi:para-aminobenzoate synthetase component I
MTEIRLAGAGWRREAVATGAEWIFHGRTGRGEIRRGGRVERVRYGGDPLGVLRGLLKSSGRTAFGYFGYEAFAPASERRVRGASLVPDFVWVGGRAGVPEKSQRRSLDPGLRRGDEPKANRKTYLAGVRRILRYIAAGDVYQANLSHLIALPAEGVSPRGYFDLLHASNPSPYACFMDFGDFSLASCSPELLLRVQKGRVATRPIAGTRRRGRDAREDRRLSGELLLSAKERAEHVMLVDLERNDLGKVCRPGSVRVTERLALEKYSHVTHIVSQVEGRLAAGHDGLDAFRAVFPGGTITGCPKVRCMEILADLERAPRGPFYGAAGWIAPDGDMELNILIRTALFRKGRMSLRVGAGIVADSDPAREWEETLHKAGALLAAYENLPPAPPSPKRRGENLKL